MEINKMKASHNMNEKDKDIRNRFKSFNSEKENTSCPDTNDFAAYLEGKTSKKQVQVIEAHLAQCSECMDALIELRLILNEEYEKPPQDVIERAKSLTPALITKKQTNIIKVPVWIRSPYSYAKKYVSIAAAAAVIIASCLMGMEFGQDTFDNRRMISSTFISEISFRLSNKTGLELENLNLFMEVNYENE